MKLPAQDRGHAGFWSRNAFDAAEKYQGANL